MVVDNYCVSGGSKIALMRQGRLHVLYLRSSKRNMPKLAGRNADKSDDGRVHDGYIRGGG